MNTTSRTMNRSRAIVIAAIAAAGLAAVAVNAATSTDTTTPPASSGHWHHHGPGAHFMHILKQLNLSAEQQTQVKSIFASAKPQFQALRASMRSNHEALAASTPSDSNYPALLATEKANAGKLIDQMSAVKTQIYAILTPEQIKQIPTIIAADKAKWQQRQHAPAASAPATSS
jgi:Spy/CpxP family protein refolding chaperone